uniref:TMV resistance protein N n=1 Tax=Cajanus cajan TaxID=3821 RepID=A0A151TP85_CAJCA|nr:TMV resistance protein N [Cajanus cajan]
MDDVELKIGDQLAPVLLKAIEESRISIVVFSENYAASSWCLDELVCIKSKCEHVWPIFYKVDPSYVRYQKGSYGEAMTKHESRFGKDCDKVHKWRSALTDIANLKGEHLQSEQGKDESKFIDDLVDKIFIKVSPKDLSSNEHIVGRKYRVEELKSLLDLESRNVTCLLGIHGVGGIGKTTLAKALYDSIYKHFESSSFLSNVRETSKQKGFKHMQERLLSEILEVKKIKLKSIEEGTRAIKIRLGLKRVLIVLDDVDNVEQLKKLAKERDWFGIGSRIVITTRDKHLLDFGGVEKRYEVKVLNEQESLELICQIAFKKSYPESNYEDLSYRAMRCCKGLPLALKVLGSHMIGKDLGGWKDALDRYEKNPHEDVQKVLRISYDSLPFNEKNIFLDIACFFKGKRLEYVKEVLDACDFCSGDGITTLVNKSLLTIDYQCQCLEMHDLLQDMGREIVREEAWNEVGERSRLWHHEDVLQVLADNNGSRQIQGIMLDPPKREEINCINTVFEKMKNLRILIVHNTSFSQEPRFLPNNLRLLDWKCYPSQSFPLSFYPRKIVTINLRGCPLLVLEKPFQRFEHLTSMDFSNCHMITKFPDVSGTMNLRELRLDKCKNLVSIHESVGHLANLVFLSASQCTQLQTIEELPKSIKKLIGLNYLDMTYCMRLQHLPSSLFMLPNFVTLHIGRCHQLRESFRMSKGNHSTCPKLETLHFEDANLLEEDIHMIIYNFPNLKDLNLSWNNFVSLPTCIEEYTKLTCLDVSYCKMLREIPELPSSVEKVDATLCNSLASETSNMLWSQVRKETRRLEVMMPKRKIPEWFDYVSKGSFLIFKARGKFPAIALAFVFGEMDAKAKKTLPIEWRAIGMNLFIEGERRQCHAFAMGENHVFLCNLQVLLSLEVWDVGNDWKTIEVHCETELSLCSWGVYVYKHETNMEDIQFMSHDPNSSLVRSLHEISEEEQIRNFELDETYRVLAMMIKHLDKLWYVIDESPELLETKQFLVEFLGKVFRRYLMNSREGKNTLGLNIEDDEEMDVNLVMLVVITVIVSSVEGFLQEDSSFEDDVNAYDLNHNTICSACLELLSISIKLFFPVLFLHLFIE